MITTSLELYDELCKNAGLNINDPFYDAEFNNQLFNQLNIKSKEDLNKIDIEHFVHEFFNALYPYSLMMSDILSFYEEAKSKSNGKNIDIAFNFEEIDPSLKFDLNSFKKYHEFLNKTIISYSPVIDDNDLEQIWHLFIEKKHPTTEKHLSITQEYIENGNKWPIKLTFENDKNLNDPELKILILKLSNIITDILNYVKTESICYLDFTRNYSERMLNKNILKTLNIEIPIFSLTGSISNRILSILYNGLNNSITDGSIVHLKAELMKILKLENDIEVDDYIEKFEEFLSLPIWKARHEIYSVWVSTKIKDATNHLSPQINIKNGKLEYGFKSYKLISYETLPVKIDLYSELKLPHNKNISSKRKEYVQPDYTIVRGSAKPKSDDAILVVECKQYKKSSKKNFSAAIVDYANAHPNAHIFLVNYGNITQSVMTAIQKHNIQESRYTLINHFEPTNSKSLNLFRDEIRNQLVTYYLEPKTISIELSWNNKFRDLDLELEFEVDQTKHYVNYSCKEYPTIENSNNEMNIKLNKDVIKNDTNHDLNDKEIIEISNFKSLDYKIRVINYSKGENFHESDAVVEIKDNNTVYKRFDINKHGNINDYVWDVFSFRSINDVL